ncbi:MAG: ACT domain-containing protein, partial [Alphaproteobacteria bacterium]|nr:ACT domain-containing protein [Alphaproteobacteria bacterium]
GSSKDWRSVIQVVTKTADGARNVTGTLFTGKEPRIVNIEGVPVEAAIMPHMLLIRNNDQPGLVGGVGGLLGNAGQNIADFRLGRQESGGMAVCLVSLDEALPDALFEKIQKLPQIVSAQRLKF